VERNRLVSAGKNHTHLSTSETDHLKQEGLGASYVDVILNLQLFDRPKTERPHQTLNKAEPSLFTLRRNLIGLTDLTHPVGMTQGST
jgi:hypothetical protein